MAWLVFRWSLCFLNEVQGSNDISRMNDSARSILFILDPYSSWRPLEVVPRDSERVRERYQKRFVFGGLKYSSSNGIYLKIIFTQSHTCISSVRKEIELYWGLILEN